MLFLSCVVCFLCTSFNHLIFGWKRKQNKVELNVYFLYFSLPFILLSKNHRIVELEGAARIIWASLLQRLNPSNRDGIHPIFQNHRQIVAAIVQILLLESFLLYLNKIQVAKSRYQLFLIPVLWPWKIVLHHLWCNTVPYTRTQH